MSPAYDKVSRSAMSIVNQTRFTQPEDRDAIYEQHMVLIEEYVAERIKKAFEVFVDEARRAFT